MDDFKFYLLLATIVWAPRLSELGAALEALLFIVAALASLWRAK